MRFLAAEPSGRRKTADLATRRQDPVAGNDQCHRIPGHGYTDIALRQEIP
jgi:hypothetical protein